MTATDRDAVIVTHLPVARRVAAIVARRCPIWGRASDFQDELTSMAMVALIQAVDEYDPARGEFSDQYLYIRVRQRLFDQLRDSPFGPSRKRRPKLVQFVVDPDHDYHLSRQPTQHRLAARIEARTKLQAAILTLRPRYRDAVRRYYYAGEGMASIGTALGVNRGRVSQMLALARRKLRPLLVDLGGQLTS